MQILADRWFDGLALREEPAALTVEGGRIRRIALGGAVATEGDVLDARGRLLLPGLVNAHVHIARGGMFEPVEPIGVRQAARNLGDTLAAGVTTVGDMGCAPALIRALRELGRRHPDAAPAIAASGPVVTAPNGYPLDWMPPLLARLGIVLACDDEAAGARAAQRVAAAGMDHVKIAVMHRSYGDRPLPALREPVARAVVAEAHRLGLRVLAHAHGVADYRVVLAAGVDAIMHSSFEPLDAELVARVKDSGAPVCPTLWLFESACLGAERRLDRDTRFTCHATPPIRRSWRRFVEAWEASGEVVPPGIAGGLAKARAAEAVRVAAANLRLLRDAGVPIAFGNDANYGFALVARPADELGAMQRAGLSAAECLAAATSGGADLLGLGDRGRIREGARADLVVVDAEAARAASAVERVHAVVAAGRRVPVGAPDPLRSGRRALGVLRGLAATAFEAIASRPT